MGKDGYIGTLEHLKEQLKLTDPMMLEGQAREVADELAISFQASCLVQYGDSLVAEAFLATRWSTNSRSLATSIGTASSSLPESALVEKMKVEMIFFAEIFMCFVVGWKHVCFPPSTCLCMSLVMLQHYFYVNLISIDVQGISNTLRHLFLNCLPAGDSFVVLLTLPATSLAPESGWLEDETSF